jgi:hypothetical protein
MNMKKYVLIVLLGALSLRVACRVAVVYAVAAPHASKSTIMRFAFNPPYEIASPHQGLWEDTKSKLFPTVYAQACFAGGCNKPGFKATTTCNPGCSAGCSCPDCANGPCTIVQCKFVPTSSSGCQSGTNPDVRCTFSCADDQSC